MGALQQLPGLLSMHAICGMLLKFSGMQVPQGPAEFRAPPGRRAPQVSFQQLSCLPASTTLCQLQVWVECFIGSIVLYSAITSSRGRASLQGQLGQAGVWETPVRAPC